MKARRFVSYLSLHASSELTTMYQKKKIPKALREQVWLRRIGPKFQTKCMTVWCKNIITVFDFQCGHDIPESKGGTTNIANLYPICARCNISMGNQYTFKEWSSMYSQKWTRFLCPIWRLWSRSSVMPEPGIKSMPNPMNQNDKLTPFLGTSSNPKRTPKTPTGIGSVNNEKP
jgi:hypothetical protein